MELALINMLRQLNRGIAMIVGLGLLGMAAFVVADIALRQVHASFGGSEELAGYAMALVSSWGMAYALMELGHIRIDLLRSRTQDTLRALFDVFSMIVMSAVVVTVAIKCWPVVARAVENGSRANTPLATPLAWVQIPWFAGWVWFAVMTCLVTLAAISLLVRGRASETEPFIGAFAEQGSLK
ncbi:TRAP transporter small permease subunit [Roseobacter weihaiensis]|uniref:TRAP transporter small permease subunit n=1 Tax=Roseobacter weihaiensis TaxID=2763262 RepID=UPI001D0A97C1|nr:TRAP transporter small permease [Roseobacter sp. H9]